MFGCFNGPLVERSVVAGLTSPSLSWEFTSASAGLRDDEFIRKQGFLGGSDGKESACNAGDLGLIPGSGRSPGKGKGYPLQCSGLENSTDRGAWCGLPSMGSQSRTEWLMLSEEAKPQGAPPLATVGIQASLFSEHFFLFPCPLSTQCPSNPHVTLNAEASWKINQ